MAESIDRSAARDLAMIDGLAKVDSILRFVHGHYQDALSVPATAQAVA
jgi:hypothetical protein